jgi:hypothetical protein
LCRIGCPVLCSLIENLTSDGWGVSSGRGVSYVHSPRFSLRSISASCAAFHSSRSAKGRFCAPRRLDGGLIMAWAAVKIGVNSVGRQSEILLAPTRMFYCDAFVAPRYRAWYARGANFVFWPVSVTYPSCPNGSKWWWELLNRGRARREIWERRRFL